MAKHRPKWDERTESSDFKAAQNYLTLQFPVQTAKLLIRKARRAGASDHLARDILRASSLPLLSTDERHVAEDLKRIQKGKSLAPIILVQGDLSHGRPFVIADGYHRMCAACHVDEDCPVRGILVSA